jgi:type IV fimbrial biogenesis protein FimT
MRTAHGWTLVEVLMATAVVAVLLASAPGFRGVLLDTRMTAAVNALVHAVQLARVQAQMNFRDVVVCRTANSRQCAAAGNWASGWLAFVNLDQDDPPVVDPGETILHATGEFALRSITSNRRAYVLRPATWRATNGTVVFCDERGARHARAVIVSYTGRPRVTDRAADGRLLSCPA